MAEIRLGWGLKVSWVSIATVCHFFSIYVVSGPLPGITGWGVSILSRSPRAAGVGGWQEEEKEEEEGVLPYRPLTPVSLGPKTRVYFVRSRSHPRHAHSWDTWWHKRGGSFRQALEFSLASFLSVGIPPQSKNMNFIPCKVLCQATLKNLLPSISSNFIFF